MNTRSIITSAIAIFIFVPLAGGIIGLGAWLYANGMTKGRRAATISSHVVSAPLHTSIPMHGGVPAGAAMSMSAEALYTAYCAQCHGPNGDGDGTQQLDRPARSFKDGGFSFGNTTTALFRTISNGIGGTPMPGFANSLSVDDRRALAKYVQSLGPPVLEVSDADMILTVDDRPQVVRGHLPSLDGTLPEHPRGLLIGTTDGLSFEYRADDVRLIAVRQGDFVERTDWTGRGGSPLKPLGNVIDVIDGGRPEPMIRLDANSVTKLNGTSVMDGHAVLRYRVESSSEPDTFIDVEEWSEAAQMTMGSGYLRHMRLNADEQLEDVVIRLPDGPTGTLIANGDESSPAIWVGKRPDGMYRIQLIDTDAPITYDDTTAAAGGVSVPLSPDLEVRLTALILPEWNDEIMATLKEEISR